MQKPMKMMLIGVAILFGVIFLYKFITGLIFHHFMASQKQTVTVSAMKAEYRVWQPQLKAAASIRAVRGVNVTTEIGGLVESIDFTPGAIVAEGTVLVTLDAEADIAQQHSLEATQELAQITYQRDKKLYSSGSINKAQLDTDEADLKSKTAQVNEQAAVVAKKTIRAPFTGRLGISAVNPGQYLNPGDKIITLQALDPLYADFYVPQQVFTQLRVNQAVEVHVDAFGHEVFTGKITTIEPLIDTNTRNGQVEATIDNPQHKLVPGMFASIIVQMGESLRYLTLPQTAISFNPYGEIVYLIKENKSKGLSVIQTFVKTGDTRGDQIAIIEGLKEGDSVVTSGQIKLRNHTPVTIDNSVVPNNNPSPAVVDE